MTAKQWKRVWDEFNDWWDWHMTADWGMQKRRIQRLVDAELRKAKKVIEAELARLKKENAALKEMETLYGKNDGTVKSLKPRNWLGANEKKGRP